MSSGPYCEAHNYPHNSFFFVFGRFDSCFYRGGGALGGGEVDEQEGG